VTGLGLHFANYAFKSKVTTLNNTDPLTAYTDSNKVLEKNKLNYNENENEYVNISNTALLENNYIAMKYTSESNNHFANYLSIFF